MKRITSFVLSCAIFMSTSAFAANTGTVGSMIREYRIAVRVQNIDPQIALNALTKKLLSTKLSKQDLIEYVESHMSQEELQNFNAIITHASASLAELNNEDKDQFQFLLEEAFAANEVTSGANYSGCQAMSSIGGVAALSALVIGFLALDARGTFGSGGIIFDSTGDTSRANRLGIAAGITGAISTIFSTIVFVGC